LRLVVESPELPVSVAAGVHAIRPGTVSGPLAPPT